LGDIQLTIQVDASIDQVALPLSQVERTPDWQYDILEVKDVSGPLNRAGAQYTLVYWRFGRRLDQRMTIGTYDPPRIVEQTANTPLGGRMTSTTRLESSEVGTQILWRMNYRLPGGPIGVLLDRLFFKAIFRRTVMRYLANLRALAEGRTPPYRSSARPSR